MHECQLAVVPSEVARVIRSQARRASRSFSRFGHSADDLEQELLLHYLRHHHQQNAGRASPATFADRICRHRLLNVFAAETAGMRSASGGLVSLSELNRDEQFAMGSKSGDWPSPQRMALRVDIDRVLRTLQSELASFAYLLAQGASVTDIAQTLGISRATAYRRLNSLREQFVLAGLHRYLFGMGREDGA